MGFRFRKSVKIAPGVRLNFGKNSTSVSVGSKGARYTVSNTGRKTASVGIPGTGLSYVETVSGKKAGKEKAKMSKKEKKATKTAKCKACGAIIKAGCKFCPDCGTKLKKPLSKKWWFWTIIVGILFSIATGGGVDTEEDAMQQVGTNISAVETQVPEPEVEDHAPVTEVPDPVSKEISEETSEQPAEEPKVELPVVAAPIPEESKTETPVVAQQSSTAEQPVEKTYVLNTNTMRFHKESCGSVKDIKDHNKGSFTGNRDDLIAQGYKSCGRCHP